MQGRFFVSSLRIFAKKALLIQVGVTGVSRDALPSGSFIFDRVGSDSEALKLRWPERISSPPRVLIDRRHE
jgi:hypothetical protein